MTAEAPPPGDQTVLAVVVAHHPGDWFEQTLESLTRQDHPRMSVVVVDTASTAAVGSEAIADWLYDGDAAAVPSRESDGSPSDVPHSALEVRVRRLIPDASFIHAPGVEGFAAAANTVLGTDLSASYLLVCHDDVALAPDAVSTLVAAALDKGADVAGPKLVCWDRPEVIQHVGLEVDRFGVAFDVAGVDELDQEQYDEVSDVFAVNSAAVLIRWGLFAKLGGFDPDMAFSGEDVDFCWRARMSGARVVVVGNTAVRHREQIAARRPFDRVALAGIANNRNSLRAMLVNHGRISLLVLVPLAMALALAEIALAAVTGRLARVRAVASAWAWNAWHLPSVLDRRRANAAVRTVRQADVAAQQYLGSAWAVSFIRHRFGDDAEGPGGFLSSAGRGMIGSLSTGTARVAWISWAVVLAVVLFGSRDLITGGVPAVGDFAPFPSEAAELLGDWWSGWSDRGGGAPSSNLGGVMLAGLLGWALEWVGSGLGLVRTLWVLAPVVVGLAGAYRMLAGVGSRRAQVGALMGYLVVPLSSGSLAGGSFTGLVGYAVAPWILRAAVRAVGAAPFGRRSQRGPRHGRLGRLLQTSLSLGTAAGLAALFAPAAAGLLLPVVVGLAIGGLLAGRPGGIGRLVTATALAVPVAAFVALPLIVDLLAAGPSWHLIADGRDGAAGTLSLGELLRFAVGPEDPGQRMWLLFAPMMVPVLVGRGWRFEQSARLWMVALTAWAAAFVSQQGLLGFGLPDPHLLLAPAAAAAAALIGLAVLTAEHDLRFSHLGWRHAVMLAAAVCSAAVVVGGVPVLEDGRWGMSRADHHAQLRFEPEVLSGSYRVLWVGAPEFLAVEGHSLRAGVAWAATAGEAVTIADRFAPADIGRSDLFETVLRDISQGRTTRGGRRLAGLGVRYVVLVQRLSPAPFSPADAASEVPLDISEAMANQLDLEILEGTNSAVDVFVNTSWVPMRAIYPSGFDSGVSSLADLDARPLGAGGAVLSGDGPPWSGSVPDNAEVLVAQTPRPGWKMTVDGIEAPRREALSWARAFQASDGGSLVLDYSPPGWRRVGQVGGVAALFVLAGGWLRRRVGRF